MASAKLIPEEEATGKLAPLSYISFPVYPREVMARGYYDDS
jgi:hypothetical protein